MGSQEIALQKALLAVCFFRSRNRTNDPCIRTERRKLTRHYIQVARELGFHGSLMVKVLEA